ncbi:MAG: 16S rRNA (cytosine(1402)-N(4))-methyltransferase RsmH [Actinomycetales bacterium]|nr:16S rRNA (cytosine(1402)-N(4))-methyltransferase RsmH [Actinomycetales bacterium]
MHVSVALDRCIDLLTPAINKSTSPVFVDATLGLGGHSFEMLTRFPNLTLIGIDRDTSAIEKASARLSDFGNRVNIAHTVFDHFSEVVKSFGFEKIDAALFDLGVSSMQLDVAERGFSYSQDAPLDMRMDQTQGITAEEIVNTWSHGDITRILRVYGEEKFAPRIADFIIREREVSPIKSTAALATLVKNAIPAAARRTGGNPSKRTFQALRIAVNNELEVIENALPQALDLLNVGGRLVVLSFQSLEDRIVKEAFAQVTQSTSPRDLPIELPGHEAKFKLIAKGEAASDSEIAVNSRAQSVRIRAVERVAA